MKNFLAQWLRQHSSLLATEPPRRYAVLIALSLLEHTPLAPKQHERQILEQFVRGELDLNQVVAHLSS